eukprot:2977036-Prymnesium_polylepis.1
MLPCLVLASSALHAPHASCQLPSRSARMPSMRVGVEDPAAATAEAAAKAVWLSRRAADEAAIDKILKPQ